MSPQHGDPQAASGGRRNVPLVPSLANMGPVSFVGHGVPQSVQRNPLAWAKGMVAGENTWAWLYEICSGQERTMGTSVVASALADVSSLRDMEAVFDRVIVNDQGDHYAVADWRGCVRVASIDLARGFGSMSTGEG